MKRIAASLLIALASGLAAAQPDSKKLPPFPSDTWFSLARTTTGFLAAGNLAGALWAFHIGGFEVKTLGQRSPPTFSIDGVVLQVKAIERKLITTDRGDLLQAHKKFEQAHLAQTAKGVIFSDHDMCRNATAPHQQWIARIPGGISQAFVTFQAGDYVLMVVSAYEDERRRQAVIRALDDICRSFKLDQT